MANNKNGDSMQLKEIIKLKYSNTPDLISKSYVLNKKNIDVFYLETVCSSDKVHDYVLKGIVSAIIEKDKIHNIDNILGSANAKQLYTLEDIEFHLSNGYTIIIFDEKIYAIETRADINRSIDRSSIEASIKGPQDAFVENYQINLGLIKKRIKDKNLKVMNMTVGKRTKTMIGILYIDGITNYSSVRFIQDKLKSCEIDGITDSSELAMIIDNENKTTFPTIIETERPDNVVSSLLEGKVAVIVDTTSNALIAPAFLSDFINPQTDRYTKSINVNFIKVLRVFCFFISMLAPALYIAISNYNQETIPTKLLINFSVQRENVPFPATIEVFLMLLVCEILRESDLRFPTIFGSAISILGALILGDASVSAGIVSPIIIIVVALTFISSLMFNDINLINSLRHYRFIFLLCASLLGLYGLLLAIIFFIINLVSINTLNTSYTIPIAPFDFEYLKKGLLSSSFLKDNKRSKNLAKENLIKKVSK